jgi:exopolysaccharide biosynthesis polyprenyl glycosylphosphotransferase
LRRVPLLGAFVVVADAAVLTLALAGAWRLWLWWRPVLEQIVQVQLSELLLVNAWMPPALGLVVAWVIALRQQGFYDPGRMSTVVKSLSALTRASLWVLVLVVTYQFFAPQRTTSRFLVVSFLASGWAALAAWRWLLLRLQAWRPLPQSLENVVIVGLGEEALHLAEELRRSGHPTWNLVGYVAPDRDALDMAVPHEQVLGRVSMLRDIVNHHKVETLVLALRNVQRDEALVVVTRAAAMGLRVLQVPFTWGLVSPRLDLADLGELQLIDVGRLSYPSAGETFKRAFDLFAVTFGGLLLSPMLLLTALAVRLDSPGPVLFSAPRVGQGGRVFPFYKFRSMVLGADAQKEELREDNEADGPLFKIREDPRVTRVGRFIRKFSLDEFPQFWNVIRGDMNLVGPRPLPVKDLEGIEDNPEIAYWFELRHQVPPGITGLWQVMGRSDLGFEEMVRLDIQYVQNWSPWLDLKILLATLPAVLRGRGAR